MSKYIESFTELQKFMTGKTIDRIHQGDAEYDDENDVYPVGVDSIVFTDGTIVYFTAYAGVYKIGEGAVVTPKENHVSAKSITNSTIITGSGNVVGL